MADGPVTAEALARIEHKLDQLLWLLLKQDDPMMLAALRGAALPQMGDVGTPCPICGQTPKFEIDFVNRVVTRKCGCKTGLQPPLSPQAFAPVTPAGGHDGRSNEDGSDTGVRHDRRRGGPRGRAPGRSG